MVRALACTPKGHRFNSQSRALSWVAGSKIQSPPPPPPLRWGACGMQPIDVSFCHQCFFLSFSSLFLFPSTLPKNKKNKNPLVNINNNKMKISVNVNDQLFYYLLLDLFYHILLNNYLQYYTNHSGYFRISIIISGGRKSFTTQNKQEPKN